MMDIYLGKVVWVVCALLLKATGSLSQLDVCGQSPLNNKIVGGENASPGSWPWQVSLQMFGSHFCGGSLINEKWVLSAAHCFQSVSPFEITVNLGMQNVDGSDATSQQRDVLRFINHEQYSGTTKNNDISLVELSSPVTFDSYITPVCLAASLSTFPGGTDVWVTGWGLTDYQDDQSLPQILQEVQVPIVSNSVCEGAYGLGSITENMICAGLAEGGKDSCQGDSGGPLVFKQNSTWVQAGIVSFGYSCASPGFPGVYTRVSQYENWINSWISSNQPGFVLANSTCGSKLFGLILTFSIIISLCNLLE